MNHLDGDTILKYALETLEPPEAHEVTTHLAVCPACRERRDALTDELRHISNLDWPVAGAVPARLPGRRSLPRFILKAAAILAVGFALGYTAARWSDRSEPPVVGQQYQPASVPVSLSQPPHCEDVDIARYYRF